MLDDKFINWNWFAVFLRGDFSILDSTAVADQVGPEPQQVFDNDFIFVRWIVIIKVNDIN
jgi:hypothetical protein